MYVYVCVCVCVCVYVSIYLCHLLFIISSVDGHLGCFQILVTVYIAVQNIGVHVSFQISIFWGLCFFLTYTQEWNCGVIL